MCNVLKYYQNILNSGMAFEKHLTLYRNPGSILIIVQCLPPSPSTGSWPLSTLCSICYIIFWSGFGVCLFFFLQICLFHTLWMNLLRVRTYLFWYPQCLRNIGVWLMFVIEEEKISNTCNLTQHTCVSKNCMFLLFQ